MGIHGVQWHAHGNVVIGYVGLLPRVGPHTTGYRWETIVIEMVLVSTYWILTAITSRPNQHTIELHRISTVPVRPHVTCAAHFTCSRI